MEFINYSNFLPFYILSVFTCGVLIGFSTLNISKKKGLNPILGFILGLFLQLIGLIIVLLLPSKNGYVPHKPLYIRLIFGLIRFGCIVVITGFIIPFVDVLYYTNEKGLRTGVTIVSLIKYGIMVIGWLFVLRGKYFIHLKN